MKIQSLSILVPAPCTNRCPFCVSRMNTNIQINCLPKSHIYDFLERGEIKEYSNIKAWMERLEYVSNLDVHSLMLTSTGEAMLNLDFIRFFGKINRKLNKPFKFIELQTSGININDNTIPVLMKSGVKTISLSVSSLDSRENRECNNPDERRHVVNIDEVCDSIKSNGMNLRMSINLNKMVEEMSFPEIFHRLVELGANQVIFRKLYSSGNPELEQNKWIKENTVSDNYLTKLSNYITTRGVIIDKNFLGIPRYGINGISTVLDEDCMNQQVADNYRYLILKPDCHLYTKWQEPASLLF
mgnify:CR=1 FL=1